MNFDKIVFLYFNQDEEENRRDDVKEKKAQSSRSVKYFIHSYIALYRYKNTVLSVCFNANVQLSY